MYYTPVVTSIADKLKSLVHVQFSEEGSNVRKMEEQAWINFLDFLDECEG